MMLGLYISQGFQGTWFLMLKVVFFLQVSIEAVCKMHIKKYVDIDSRDLDRDFFLCRKDVVNVYNRSMKGNYQLHKKYEMSVSLWYAKNQTDFFFYQKTNAENVPFIARI